MRKKKVFIAASILIIEIILLVKMYSKYEQRNSVYVYNLRDKCYSFVKEKGRIADIEINKNDRSISYEIINNNTKITREIADLKSKNVETIIEDKSKDTSEDVSKEKIDYDELPEFISVDYDSRNIIYGGFERGRECISWENDSKYIGLMDIYFNTQYCNEYSIYNKETKEKKISIVAIGYPKCNSAGTSIVYITPKENFYPTYENEKREKYSSDLFETYIYDIENNTKRKIADFYLSDISFTSDDKYLVGIRKKYIYLSMIVQRHQYKGIQQ